MAEPYNNPPPSGSHHPLPAPVAGGEDNEPRIDGDGQEVNALRFLGAGGPPAPPPPSITPVSAGVSQPLPPQHSQQPPAPPQTPHQHQPSAQSIPQQSLISNTPGGVGSAYDPYSDPTGVGGAVGAYHPHSHGAGPMQIPAGPMSGPYGMAAGPPGAPPGMMAGPGMMMMPSYGYGMYPSPYGFMGAATPYPAAAMAPQQPANSQSQLSAMLHVLRVNNPKYYREWYKKYTAHKRNPDRVPFPTIPPVPGFPQMGGPGSSQTLPFPGRSRKESSRSSINGDASYSRSGHHPNDSFTDYSSLSHVPNTSRGHGGHHSQRPLSRASVNGEYKSSGIPLEDEFDIDGAANPDMSSLSMSGHVGQNSLLHSTFNTSYQPHHQGPGSGSDRDRPQTQSGRSSIIGEPCRLPPGDIYVGGDQHDSLNRYDSGVYNHFNSISTSEQQREPSPIRRMTPMKFSTFHCIAAMSPLGHMIRIKNAGTVLEFIKMKNFIGHLPEYKEMESFPGPLTQISTHKNTVIQFCKRKIKEARSNPAQLDRENYILLWEFLMLMLRQNGMVVGSDIAELLLTAVQQQQEQQQKQKQIENLQNEQVRDSVEGSDGSGGGGDSSDDKEEGEGESYGEENEKNRPPPLVEPSLSSKDEKKLVEEFCSHLLYGHKKDALDFAMDHGLWGHALFFASKMDERSYGHVLARFANGIPLNSPLQTLYHIMCGKQPASVTSCGDGSEQDENTQTFGDWKPHLAMLLSNCGYKPEVEQRAILTLGDTLQSKGHWFAAQFCFLMGHEEFRKDSRLGSLLGYSHQKKNTLEATQMTEVYEFARKLADPGFSLGTSFLQSKLDYAKRLVSYGFVEEALAYCEEITKVLRQSGRKLIEHDGESSGDELIKLCINTLKIAERIAVADESGTASGTWVEDLRKMTQQPEGGLFEDEDTSRKLSLVSSTNQEQHSDQASYTSSSHHLQQQPPLQLPTVGESNSSSLIYDPYGTTGQNSTQQSLPQPDVNNLTSYNTNNTGVITMMTTTQMEQQQNEVPQQLHQIQQTQDNSNWGQNTMMMNGGLHLSQPSQMTPPSQQSNMYDPPQMMNNLPSNNSYGQNESSGSGGYQQQQTGLDAGYSSGAYSGDKLSTAAPTINNNHWYNPYDSQPQLGHGGGSGGGNQNGSPVKKKSVRFEDEHQHHLHDGLVGVEGNIINGYLIDGGVQSLVRARGTHGGGRPTSLDLKSALKTTSVGNSSSIGGDGQRKRERQNNGLNGSTDSTPLADLERCSSTNSSTLQDKSQYFEVEYKSTYPIDEPIEASLPSTTPQVGASLSSMRLASSKRSSSSTSIACPPVNHPYPVQQLIINNHHASKRSNSSAATTSSSTTTATTTAAEAGPITAGGKTFQIDKKCCDVNQPCADHHNDSFNLDDDIVDQEEVEEEDDELEDDDEVDEDEEGGVGEAGGGRISNVNNNDIEGVENGGYHHRHQQQLHHHHSGHFTRFENKTESSKPPAPSSNDKKGADKKKSSSKDPKSLDGSGQQEKGWFSGLFKTLSLKPKNQMILPDDKNPTIVWDPKEERWVNTAADGEDDTAPAGPPPKDSELMGMGGGGRASAPPQMMPNGPQQPMMMPPPQHQQQQQNQQQQPMMMGGGGGATPYQQQQQQQPALQPQQPSSLPSTNPSLQQQQQPSQQGMMMSGMPSLNNNNNTMNKYKLQRGRGLKGYVDVLNPNGPTPSATSPGVSPPMQPNHHQGGGAPVPNLFIPPPMPQGGSDVDGTGPVSFLTAPAPSTEDNNLSAGQQGQENSQPPPMFNPAQFQGYSQGQ